MLADRDACLENQSLPPVSGLLSGCSRTDSTEAPSACNERPTKGGSELVGGTGWRATTERAERIALDGSGTVAVAVVVVRTASPRSA
jgi:hypothetical protein